FKGSSEKVNFSSNPDGAKIYVNGQMIGETPYQMNLSSKDTHTIEFRKEGYETRTYIINSKMAAGYLVLDILFGFIPVIVDAATGAWMTLETANVMAQLEKKEASAP
ncbi:MAG: PEGA domain-containing protein, partial [Ignavibacteriales bacterium]|nr:PEGA domain-containing protein [Ignavibacteriales bacterium]